METKTKPNLDEIIAKLEQTPAHKQWKEIGIKNHHGFDIPLFSLHSANSCGIGEFTDLLPLIDWCKEIGIDVIQLLPIFDTGLDSSPYNAISAFALHPIYIGLANLPNLDKHVQLQEWLKALQSDHSEFVDYPKTLQGKELFTREYYQLEKDTILARKDFKQFVAENPWLKVYALFKVLKNQYHWKYWEEWPEHLQNPTPELIDKLVQQYQDEINYHYAMQFFAFQQMEAVKKAANAKGVQIMGDIPILISPDSADVWDHRNLFHMEYTAGAPPDMLGPEGQNWGFPIYNWEEMRKNNYAWWKERLDVSSRLYNLYRIDHIVGFFRIWAIPKGRPGHEGYFLPKNESEWIPHGKEIMLFKIHSSPMLPIGEDLGTVPPVVRECLKHLGICGTKVMRWERRWNEDKGFIKPEDYPPESMTTVSTHDSQTLILWWKNNPQEAKDYAAFKGWEYAENLTPQQQYDLLWDSHHSGSLFHINLLQEYLALVPGMTRDNAEDERINVPGIISNLNWRYRFKPSVEELTSNADLKALIKGLTK